MCNVIIIGAGGHAKVIADIVIKNGDNLLGFLDDRKKGIVIDKYSVIGTVDDIGKFVSDNKFIIAIGNNLIRERIAKNCKVSWYTAIHPSAQIGMSVSVGEGTCVLANAIINSDAKIGKHAIINTSSIVEHDCMLSDFVHVSPSGVICGTVSIGKCVHIGANATVINNINICDYTIVGATATVVKDINEQGVYIGVPAKKKD